MADSGHFQVYAFATGGNGHNIQVAVGGSRTGPWSVLDTDALPTVGAWSNGQNVWAPSVLRRRTSFPSLDRDVLANEETGDDGLYVMYYSATYAKSTAHHCNGAATSTSPIGPYTPLANTLGDCQLSQGGSIDPAGRVSPS